MKQSKSLVMMLLLLICGSASATVTFKFDRSLELRTPFSEGLKRGISLKDNPTLASFPDDVESTFPQDEMGMTPVQLQYASQIALPTVRAGYNVGRILLYFFFGGVACAIVLLFRNRHHA